MHRLSGVKSGPLSAFLLLTAESGADMLWMGGGGSENGRGTGGCIEYVLVPKVG